MNTREENLIINYPKELKGTISKIQKELKRFTSKYKKILVLDKQKEIEINFIDDESHELRVTGRVINAHISNKINIREISIIIEEKVIDILEKDKVYIPEYVKEQINDSYNIKSKIKSNSIETENILRKMDKN